MDLELSKLMLSVFVGRHDHVAVCKPGEHFKPHKLDKPLTPAQFNRTHFNGICLGLYPMHEDNTIRCAAVDFDNHNGSDPGAISKAIQCAEHLTELGLSPLLEVSQSGEGAHVWLFFDEHVSAMLVRKLLKHSLNTIGMPGKELYPSQDDLSVLRVGLGNLIRFPLFNKSRFIDTEGEELDPVLALSNVSKSNEEEIDNLISWVEPDYEPVIASTGLPIHVERLLSSYPSSWLSVRWAGDTTGMYDPSRSSLLQAITLELVKRHVHPLDIKQTINYWCDKNGYDKGLREDWQDRTISKAYEMAASRFLEREAITDGTFAGIAEAYLERLLSGEASLVSTGVGPLDESFGGFGPGEYTLIVGRPSQGKTALALQCLESAAINGYPGLYVSLEMGPERTASRLITRLTDRNRNEWLNADVNSQLSQAVRDKYKHSQPVYFVKDHYHIDEIEDVIREYVEEKEVKVVVVDYHQLIQGDESSEYLVQTEASKRLKRLADELNVVMLNLAMMGRDIEFDNEREPVLGDIKGSGQLEQDGDLILMVRHPYKWDHEQPKDLFKVYVKKCRNRECNTECISMTYDLSRQEFR